MTYPPQYPQPPYVVQLQRPPSNGQAVGSMVLGIIAAVIGFWSWVPLFGLVAALLGFIPAVVAVILGHMGMATSARLGGVGRSQAITGLLCGYLILAIIIVTTIFWILAIVASAANQS